MNDLLDKAVLVATEEMKRAGEELDDLRAENAALKEYRRSAAHALQALVHEAASSGRTFIRHDTAERLIDRIVLVVLQTIQDYEKDTQDGNSPRT